MVDAQNIFQCLPCSTPDIDSPLIVFVDHDNLLMEAQKLGAMRKGFVSTEPTRKNELRDHRVHINYKRLGDLIAKGRDMKGTSYSCYPVLINDRRFSLESLDRSIHTGGQKEVDTTIVTDMLTLEEFPPPTVALVSGDRDMRPSLRKIIEKKWKVEIYMWNNSTAECLKELDGSEYEPLDENFDKIIDRVYYSANDVSEESTLVLTVTRGAFGEDQKIYHTHQKWWNELEQLTKWPVQYKWEYEWETEPRNLLLVFMGLAETEIRRLAPKIASLDKDEFPHEGRCVTYTEFKQKKERSQSKSVTPSESFSLVTSR
jgi:uncharacterized LabA/DUF88 family protein